MSPRLSISSLVIQRLNKLEENSTGQVLGLCDDKSINVIGISRHSYDTSTEDSDFNADLIQNLPANINVCGIFKVLAGENTENINDLVEAIEGTPVIISVDFTSKVISTSIFEDGKLQKVSHIVVSEKDLCKQFLHLRITATIPISCDFQYDCMQESFSFIQQKITGGNAAFHIIGGDVHILGENSEDVNGMSPDSLVEELSTRIKEIGGNENGIGILNVGLYLNGSNNGTEPQLAPYIKYVKKVFKHAGIQLPVDTLAVAPRELKLKELYPVLVESVCRNLSLNEMSLLEQLKSSGIKDVSLPQTYHFFPKVCGHFISIVYPSKRTCDQLKKVREEFHELLSLPMDTPAFRRGNAFDFSQVDQKTASNILLNPHEGLAGSGVPDGEPYFVQGTYAYHHYMQDKFDDNGWGCAYRSLQTIFSWFRFQGYTNMSVPDHKQIQQCLVNIGDKPRSFVGSKQWIGSTEVSFVLDALLGVTSRIVSVSSGEEMSTKGGELSHHFKTQGTPIMIGGGVLAHTIIGVDYNKKTGAIKFLILDPHYTGGEDLKLIQSKGWCGWKGLDFWKKDAFYNMCLPLRPKCV